MVSAREKFRRLLILGARARERDTVGREHLAMHEIVHRLAGEGVALQCLAEQRVAINANTATGRDMVR
jgi:hypothetical protein